MSPLVESIVDVTSSDTGEPMAVCTYAPDDGLRHPTIVMFHDAPGVRASSHEFNRRLASEGYRVVMPDLHHRHGRLIGFEPPEITPEIRRRIVDMLHSMTDAQIQRDLDDALSVIELDDGEQLGALGFCLGARAIYRTLRRLPQRFVVGATWHPSLLVDDEEDSPHRSAGDLSQPLYIGIGTADQVQSIELQQPFFDAVADLEHVEVEIFDGADHGYTWPAGPNYHEAAATGSWAKTVALFAANLSQ